MLGVLFPCLCVSKLLWLLFVCGYLLQVALCQTLSYMHTWLPTWMHTSGLSVWEECLWDNWGRVLGR